MRHVNGVYTQTFNRRHAKVGHLFQGRFKAVLVDRDAYLLEVCRYVELNPVRAAMVHAPDAWPWSSYLAHVNRVEPPDWLDTAGLHGYLLGYAPRGPADQRRAAARYVSLVAAGRDVQLRDDALRQQLLGRRVVRRAHAGAGRRCPVKFTRGAARTASAHADAAAMP